MVLTQDAIRNMNEADLRKRVIIPLMKAMKYKGVFEWHGGSGELGKDVVGWKENDLGSRRNLAVVAKAGRISGAQKIGTVKTQVSQAFNTTYLDPLTGRQEQIHQCWIVANGRLGKEAREGIRASLPPDFNRNVWILDGDDLWEQVSRYLAESVFDQLDNISDQLVGIDSPFDIGVQTAGKGRPFASLQIGAHQVDLYEKYPGQLNSEPLKIDALFEFPDTPEGRKKRKEFEAAFKKGNTARIPGDYVIIELPESLDNLMVDLIGQRFIDTTEFTIGQVRSDRRFPVRIDVACDDSDSASLDYIELEVTRSGQDEFSLSNNKQALPVQVDCVIDLKQGLTKFTVTARDWPIASPVLLHLFQFLECASKPCRITLRLIDPGLSLGVLRSDGKPEIAVDPQYIELLSDLVAIQDRLGVPIYIPEGEFSEQDLSAIAKLRVLLRTNEIIGTWTRVIIKQDRADAWNTVNNVFGDGQTHSLRAEVYEELKLFGHRIPLGKTIHVFDGARLDCEPEMQQLIDESQEDEAVDIRIVATGNRRVHSTYCDW